MQKLTLEQLLAAADVLSHHVGENGHRIGVFNIGKHIPLGGACAAALVAAPAHIFATKHHSLGRKRVNKLHPRLVVVALTALALGVRAIKPHLVNLAVFGEQFEQLIEEIFVVIVYHKTELRLVGKLTPRHLARYFAHGVFAQVAVKPGGVFNLIEVGWRKIYAQLQAVFVARRRKVLEHIALAAAKTRRHHAVSGVTALPQAKAVVVLGCENHHLHARTLHGTAPLVGVERLEVENARVLLAGAPLHARERVRPKMYERNKLVLKRTHLVSRRHHVGSLFHYHGRAIGIANGYGVGKLYFFLSHRAHGNS